MVMTVDPIPAATTFRKTSAGNSSTLRPGTDLLTWGQTAVEGVAIAIMVAPTPR